MRKSAKPTVRDGLLLHSGSDAASHLRVGSREWLAWLADNECFTFIGDTGHFSAQRETRRGIAYWYAYRRRNGHLYKAYLGKSESLTPERLAQVASQLAGRAPAMRLAGKPRSELPMTALIGLPDYPGELAVGGETFSVLPLTKFEPPALPEKLIERARLVRRIKAPVTLIYAPSGFGKSTLLNEWRQTCGFPVAWVSLDAEDDQPTRFWFTLGMALRAINPDLSQTWLRQLRPASPSHLPQLVVELANAIVCATDAPGALQRFGLVLDDYHHIRHPDIHAALQTLLEHLPLALQLVISSRTRPPLVLGQLRAKGLVAELETDDLRFTLEEGIEFLWRHTPDRHLSYYEMQTLVKHTEGWVAGLNLATLALAHPTDRRQLMTAFNGAHTYLREYFTESVLYRQPPDVQAFLFKTAILKHLNGSLCDAVTGQGNGSELLERLWQENLFLVRLQEPGWYRYHDLFAQMLYSQLQVQYPTEIPRLHRRAAEWYCAHNAPADAVHHLLAVQAWEEAAALIERMALRELEQSGEDSRLLRWLHQLPESVVQQHKTLLFVYVRLAGSALPWTEVEEFLARVEANILRRDADELTPDERDVLSDIRQIRSIAHTGRPVAPHVHQDGEIEAAWQLLNGILLYQHFNCPDVKRAAMLARQVYEAAREQRNLFVILMAGGALALNEVWQGRLREGEQTAHQVLQYALTHRGLLPEPSSIALAALCLVWYYRNQLDQALQFLLRASEVDPNPMSSNMPIMIAVQRAKIESAQGHFEAAQATLQAARELHARQPANIWLDQDLVAYKAFLYLRQGAYASAEQTLNEIQDADSLPSYTLVRAMLLLHQQRFSAAEALFSRLLRQYPHGFHQEPVMSARIGLANALFAQHRVNEARQVMAAAIRQAAPERLLRPFLDQALQSVQLLALVLQTGTLTDEATRFVRDILDAAAQISGAPQPPTHHELLELTAAASISPREQEILRLVSAGLSNREIAARSCISLSTVKTHLDNIYRKLGVNSRTQAVAEAQILKLV